MRVEVNMTFDTITLRRVALEACATEVTARRWARGEPVKPATSARLEASARRLGVALPAAQAPAGRPSSPPEAA